MPYLFIQVFILHQNKLAPSLNLKLTHRSIFIDASEAHGETGLAQLPAITFLSEVYLLPPRPVDYATPSQIDLT